MLIEIIFDWWESLAMTAVFVGWTNNLAAIEQFLHAKWQELFRLFMADSMGTLQLICWKKSTSDWIRRGKPARKNMYYHYSASRLDRSFSGFIHSRSSPTFPCSFIAVFSFLVRFFRFFELVHGHFHVLGLFLPKRITPRKMFADGGWSIE